VSGAEVRPEEDERVGESADGGAEVGVRAAFPVVVEAGPVRVEHALGDGHVEDVEAGAQDDGVDVRAAAVRVDDAAAVDGCSAWASASASSGSPIRPFPPPY
jgi:hypothetical protein